MNLKKDEFELHGKWIFKDGKFVEDAVAKRINYLKDNFLLKVAVSETGWEILYQDPIDKRYWELKYNDSELQGAGSPSLVNIKKKEVQNKYNLFNIYLN